jgi:ferric-dicitrate binding protein FerR (iron transport regulator)
MAHAARIYDAGVDGQWYDDLPQFRGDRVERRKHRSSAHRALVRNQQRLFERCRTGLRERRGAQERHGDREPPARRRLALRNGVVPACCCAAAAFALSRHAKRPSIDKFHYE